MNTKALLNILMSLIAGLLLLVSTSVMAFSRETVEEEWVNLFESESGFAATLEAGMDVDGEGNIFRQGYERFSIEIDGETEPQQRHRWVTIKYDQAGTERWLKTWEVPGESSGWAQSANIIADGAGGAYVSGGVSIAGPATVRLHTKRYAASGDVIWERDYIPQTSNPEEQVVPWNVYCKVISPGSEEEYIIVAGTFSWGPWPDGEFGVFALKYSSDGEIIEGSEHVFYDMDDYSGMYFDDDGNLYVTGSSLPADNMPNQDIITRKFDSDMNLVWEHAYNSPYNETDTANTVHVDGKGYVYLGGVVETDETFIPYPQYPWYTIPVRDAVTMKLDPDGYLLWATIYAAPDTMRNLARVVPDSEGNAYMTGYHVHEGLDFDTHLVKYTSDSGKEKWVKLIEGPAYDVGGTVTLDAEDKVIRTFTSQGALVVQKLHPKGDVLWEYSKTGEFVGQGSVLDDEGNVYISAVPKNGAGMPVGIMTIKLDQVGHEKVSPKMGWRTSAN